MIAADDVRVGIEGPLPEAVTENDDGRLTRARLRPAAAAGRRAASRRAGGTGWKRSAAPSTRCASVARQQRTGAPLRNRHLFERLILVPDVDVLPRRRPVLRDVDTGRTQPQHRQPIRCRDRAAASSSSALTTLKMAVLAPMPMASEPTITTVRPRCGAACARRSEDPAGMRSCGGPLPFNLPVVLHVHLIHRRSAAHVTPDVRAVELPAIVEQPLTSHAVVESQCRIAEFRKENE